MFFNANAKGAVLFTSSQIITLSVIFVALGAVCVLCFVYFFGSTAQRRRGPDTFALPPQDGETALDGLIGPLEAERPEDSGLQLLPNNLSAFAARWQTARQAGRSLDLQYYYWKGDLTGRLLCLELIRAADRGVRVRLLLDDMNSFGFDSTYVALDSHPNIEVRLFNPSRSRSDSFRRGLELVLKYFTATRRMHNKCWIADGRIAIAGGRNIGDAYFDASEAANFQDIDVVAIGKAVEDAEAVFDKYWNSEAAMPIRQLIKIRRPKLAKLIRRLQAVSVEERAQKYLKLSGCLAGADDRIITPARLHWSQHVEVVADPPEKASGKEKALWLGQRLVTILQSATATLRIVSPYFIPGDAGASIISGLAAKGVDVRVLTNSLAATDVIAVHGAYARYRARLIRGAVSLYELKPEPGRHRASLFGSKTASLHTKALLVDSELGFVGSFNLDPRSHSINTEMGIIFRCPNLARQLQSIFDSQTSAEISYRVTCIDGALTWTDRHNGIDRTHGAEPDAPLRRTIPAALLGWLPIESQL